MPNKWIDFVKRWSRMKGMSYGCALSDPQLRIDYNKSKATPKQEREMMGMEDRDAPEILSLNNYKPFLYDKGNWRNKEKLYLNPKNYIRKSDEGKKFPYYIANAIYLDIADAITRGGRGYKNPKNKIFEEANNLRKQYKDEGSLKEVLDTLKKLAELLKRTGYTYMNDYSTSSSSFRKRNIIEQEVEQEDYIY